MRKFLSRKGLHYIRNRNLGNILIQKNFYSQYGMKVISLVIPIILMNALIDKKEIQALIKKHYPQLQVEGWHQNGLVVSTNMATLEKQEYNDEIFFSDTKKKFIFIRKDGWRVSLQ